MPISSAGHLPYITSTSYPTLVSYLGSNFNAQRVSSWTVSIRVLKSSFENSKESPTRPKLMYVVSLSEYPSETFILIEDGEKDTRATIKTRLIAQKQQEMLIDGNMSADGAIESTPRPDNLSQLKASLQTTSTRYTLFASSSQFSLLINRLNLPPPLGAPSMGDGVANNTQTAAGPGAWLPRGAPLVIEGATYELPSATRYSVEESPQGSNCEWRVRLGMLQTGGTRGAGAMVENEYLPLNRLEDPTLLLSHLQSLFPIYLTNPTQEASAAAQSLGGIAINYPSVEQWQEVVPSSNESWCENLGKAKVPDDSGWRGKERGRRLAFLYITLFRKQGVL